MMATLTAETCSLPRASLAPDAPVSCVFCLSVYPFKAVVRWVDGGRTPLCPLCGRDFVVPGALAAEVLADAHRRAFGLPPPAADLS